MEENRVDIILNYIMQLLKHQCIAEDKECYTKIFSQMNYRELVYLIVLIDQKLDFDMKKFIDSDLDCMSIQNIIDCIK